MNNSIPVMDDPMGKYWEQPRDITQAPVDDKTILLRPDQFRDLREYSTSIPSGVYPGKCWKAQDSRGWFIRWYGPETLEGNCQVNNRDIVVVEETAKEKDTGHE